MTPSAKSKQDRFFFRDGVCEKEKKSMTSPNGKTASQEINEEYRAFIDALPQFVWLMQPDGSLVYANQRWRDYRHLLSQHAGEQEEFAHQQGDDCPRVQDRQHTLPHAGSLSDKEVWLQNFHPEDRERILALQRQALATGDPYEFEYRLRDGHTGAYRWFLSRRVPLRNEAGQIVLWVATCTDIDEQKRTEEALRQSQERIRALIDSHIIGVVSVEEEARVIVDANDAWLRMSGYTREDVGSRTLTRERITRPEDAPLFERARQEVDSRGQCTPFETELVCKDGSRLPVVMGGVLFQDHPRQTVAFVLDNSAHQELEQRKNAFLSIANHELRTPLACLKLQTQLLRKKLEKRDLPNVEVVCARMETQLNAITRLVDEFLDLSHIQAGELEYAHEPVDLDELLEDVVELMRGIHLTHTVVLQHAASPAVVVGDHDRLVQVFLNLLSNAIKYAPDAPLIDVTLHTEASAVTVSVRDQGIGISHELHERVFERFYRAVPPQQHAIPGCGMGLYIVAEMVKHHGGTIRVESEEGKGSTFHITFPLEASARKRAPEESRIPRDAE
jgi:PAS domain S-box-containing protein